MKKCLKAFTAVEVTMVAAVIAILALIILPLFQKRADKARIAAVQDDLAGLAKAEILANADTDWYFRLQDLDNTKLYPGTANQINLAVPYAVWDRALTTIEREVLQRRWEGPYIAVQTRTSALVGVARLNWNPAFFSPNAQGKNPILLLSFDNDDDKIPIDPWGGPYIFFASSETDYNYQFSNCVIYSMGPDGLPGDGTMGIGGDTLIRDFTDIFTLGNGDDFKYVF